MLRALIIVFLCVSLLPRIASAEDVILEGRSAKVTSDSWTIMGLETRFELTASGLNGELRMSRITIQESGQSFDDVRVACVGILGG